MFKQTVLLLITIALLSQLSFCDPDPYPNINPQGELFCDWSASSITDTIFASMMTKFQNKYDDTDQLLSLQLKLNGNLISNFAPLLKLIIYTKMTSLQIRAAAQINKITRLEQFTFLRTMKLTTFLIDLTNNAISDVVFLTPALTLTTLQNIYITLDGNLLSDSGPFSLFTTLTNLQYLELRLTNNYITNYTSLTNLYYLSNLKDIILAVEFHYAQNNYTFMANYNNAPALEYFQTLIGACYLNQGNYLYLNKSDPTTYYCYPCYDLCERCYGSQYNQCLSCKDKTRFIYNPSTQTCDYKVPQPIDGYLTLNFELSSIDTYIFGLFMQQFQRSYTVDAIRGLDLNLGRNNITNLTAISKLTPYSNIKNMTIRFNTQSPEITTIDNIWDFTSGMILQQLYITMRGNLISNLTFLTPIFQVQSKLVDLILDFSGNSIQDITAFSYINNLIALRSIDLTITGFISSLSPLSAIGQLQNIENIRIQILQLSSSVPVTFEWVSNFNYLLNLTYVNILTPSEFICNLNNNTYIGISDDKLTLSCQKCYMYCKKCFGPNDNQCLSCQGNKFIINPTNHTCDLQLPPILPGGIVIIDFDSLLITTPVLISLMALFKQKYPLNAICELKMDFRYNTIDNYDSFDMLSEYQNISLMEFDLGYQIQSTFKMNYNYSRGYNYIYNLSEYQVDGRECKMYNSYITILRGGIDWACSPCGYQCAKCFGPNINQCLSCVDNYRLVYDPVNHTCHFLFPDIDDGLLLIDICKLHITNNQLPDFMYQLLMYYQLQIHNIYKVVFISLCGSQISDYSALNNLTNFGHASMLELQIQSPTKQINFQFLNNYNYMTNLTYFEENSISCNMDHTFIRVASDNLSWSCDSCYTHCAKCFGPSSNECLACDSSCSFEPDTHSCLCKATEQQFIQYKLKEQLRQ